MNKPNPNWVTVTMILALIATITLIRIELLNQKAGYYLPRGEYRNGARGEGFTTWRLSPITSEAVWWEVYGPADENGKSLSRNLTVAEKEEMNDFIKKTQAKNYLRGVVGFWGLLQYPIVFAGMVLSILVIYRKPGTFETFCVLLSIGLFMLAGLSMFYRGYFTSLGW